MDQVQRCDWKRTLSPMHCVLELRWLLKHPEQRENFIVQFLCGSVLIAVVKNSLWLWIMIHDYHSLNLKCINMENKILLDEKYIQMKYVLVQAWLALMSSSNDFQITFAFELWVSEDNFWRASHPHSPPWIKTEPTLDRTWLILTLHEAIKQF